MSCFIVLCWIGVYFEEIGNVKIVKCWNVLQFKWKKKFNEKWFISCKISEKTQKLNFGQVHLNGLFEYSII